jgi:hypothetical protein
MTAYFSLQQGKNSWLNNLLKTKNDELTGVNRKFTPYWKNPAYLLRKYRRKHPPRWLLTPKQSQQGKAIEQPSTPLKITPKGGRIEYPLTIYQSPIEQKYHISRNELNSVIDLIEESPIPTSEKRGWLSSLFQDYIVTPSKRYGSGLGWTSEPPEEQYVRIPTTRPPKPKYRAIERSAQIPKLPRKEFRIPIDFKPITRKESKSPIKSQKTPGLFQKATQKKGMTSADIEFWNSPTQRFILNEIISGRKLPDRYQNVYLSQQGYRYNRHLNKWIKK